MSFRHLDQYADRSTVVTRLSPVTRLLGTVTIAVGASVLPLGAWPQLAALVVVVTLVSAAAGIPARSLVLRMAAPFTFVFAASAALLVLVPGETVAAFGPLRVTDAGLERFGSSLGRAAVALAAAVVLVSTTRFPELVDALRVLRLPRAVTTALTLAYRILYVTVDEVERMQRAARSRNAGHGAAKRRRLLAAIVAAVIQRALFRSERTHQAMLARGFRGELTSLHQPPLDVRSVTFLGALIVVVAVVAVSGYLGR